MFDYRKYFDLYCRETSLPLRLSFDMPAGYESANGMFHQETGTVFINAAYLSETSDCDKLFYLFHELRHASQYLAPENFSPLIRRSLQYAIMYDGTCYKMINGAYRECRLDGDADFFKNLYLGQPYEADANSFAYEQTKNLLGPSERLETLKNFWLPASPLPAETYREIYSLIDEKTSE